MATGRVSGACGVESGQEQTEVTGHDTPLHSRGGGQGRRHKGARDPGKGVHRADCWTQTSLSQLESSSKPCSAQAGCRAGLSGVARAAAAWAGKALPVPRGSPGV